MFRQEPFPGEMRWALAWIVKYFVTHNVYYVKSCIFHLTHTRMPAGVPAQRNTLNGTARESSQWLRAARSVS